MKGVQAWDASAFHAPCRQLNITNVQPIDFAGFKYLYCFLCGVLCNMEAVSPKFEKYTEAMLPLPELDEEAPDAG